MKRLSDKTRLKEKRCTGHGLDYVPWIKVREVSSNGTSSIVTNWKTTRRTHLLSLAEKDVFYTLNYREDVLDIREQFALLNKDLVNQIAEKRGYKKPVRYLSTDLLLTTSTGVGLEAVSVKATKNQIQGDVRALEKLIIEKEYWNSQNIPFYLMFGEDINKIRARNIRLCSEIDKTTLIEDDVMALKYLILIRAVNPDLDCQYLNFSHLLNLYKTEVDLLYENTNENERPYWNRKTAPKHTYRDWNALYQIE